MKASDLMLLAFVSWLACACAEAYDTSPPGTLGSAVLTPPTGGVGGMGGAAADPGAGAIGGGGGIAPPLGEPCTEGDVMPCPCEGTTAQGQRTCRFDMASPTLGFFSDCQACPPAEMPDEMPAAGTGGMSGAGGMSGDAGTGGEAGTGGAPPADAGSMEEPNGPVDDCDGVPEGTECDRDCILPSNTARCNESGDCSCL